jgi:imidazolonepropionase-like amidohydrolase
MMPQGEAGRLWRRATGEGDGMTPSQQVTAITGVRLVTISGPVHDPGTLVFAGDRITALGPENQVTIPDGAERVEARGMTLMPGLIDAHTHLGIFGEGRGEDNWDGNEKSDPITPELRARDSLDPNALGFPDVRAAGVTTVMTSPGSGNVIGGTCLAIRTRGRTVDELTRRDPVGMKMALGFNPKNVYGISHQKRPVTRMASAALLRNALVDAQNYAARRRHHGEQLARMQRKPESERDPVAPFERNLKHEALLPVLDGTLIARCHAHRADDILTALRIAGEFGLRLSLEHCTEGYKVARELAAAGVTCVLGPHFANMRYKAELMELNPANAALLHEAGVKICIQTDASWGVQWLANNAALCVRHGLPEEIALRAITLNAAELLGLGDELGSLEVGKIADLLLVDGDPLDLRSPVAGVWQDGEACVG